MKCLLARRAALLSGLVALFTLLPRGIARAGTDVFQNIGPASPLPSGGQVARYPWDHYALDIHFAAIKTSLTGGVDVSGLLPTIAWFFASFFWILTSLLARIVVELFGFAFNLDLVGGSEATGGAGALAPVSQAIHSIYANVFGAPWLVVAISAVGMWAMWKALVQRRYSETAGALAMSLLYVVVAFFFVFQPGQTIGQASRWTNEMSQAFLSISNHGNPSGGEAATAEDADQLWDLLVMKPWSVLQFGGLEHCAVSGTGDEDSDPDSTAVRPLSQSPARDAELAHRLQGGTEVSADGKTCVNNLNKYGRHFLRFGFGTDERGDEYDALNAGDAEKLPDADDEKAGYNLGVVDKPATDAMEEGGQYQRLAFSFIVFLGELGAFALLGSLSLAVIISQVLLLLLLAFAPVALVAAAIPGRGHDFFVGWAKKLGGYLLRKAAYSLVLAILLAVNEAIAGATSSLGWLFAFGLQAAFFWAVLIQRRTLTDGIAGIATGSRAPGHDLALDALALYAGARLAGAPLRGAGWVAGGAGRLSGAAIGRFRRGRGASEAGRRRPSFGGTSYSASVGGGSPSMGAPGPAARGGAAAAASVPSVSKTSATSAAASEPAASGSAASRPAGARAGSSAHGAEPSSRPLSAPPILFGAEAGAPNPGGRSEARAPGEERGRTDGHAGGGGQEASFGPGEAGPKQPRPGRRPSRPGGPPAQAPEGEPEQRSGRPAAGPSRSSARSGPGDRIDSGASSAPPSDSELSEDLRAERERAKPDTSGSPDSDAPPPKTLEPQKAASAAADNPTTGSPGPISPPRRRRHLRLPRRRRE